MLWTLQLSTTILVVLTSLILAGAEESPLPALTVPVAIATWWYVDRRGMRVMPQWGAALLGLLAFAAAGFEYLVFRQQSVLGVGGHLLSYLIWSLLLLPKEVRQYWTIFALCILQIAVSSLLTYSIWFGLSLLLFSLVAIWTLSIFLLYRSTRDVGGIPASGALSFWNDEGRNPQLQQRIGKVWNGVATEVPVDLLPRRLLGNSTFFFSLTLLGASLFFLLIPRYWPTSTFLQSIGAGSHTLTGFTKEVRLGDLGEILEDSKEVMRVTASYVDSQASLDLRELRRFLGEEPLFRGAVLERYDTGRWRHEEIPRSRPATLGAGNPVVRVKFELTPLGVETLFSYGNTVGAVPVNDHYAIQWKQFSDELRRIPATGLGRSYSYQALVAEGPADAWLARWRQRVLDNFLRDGTQAQRPGYFSVLAFDEYLSSLVQVPRGLNDLRPITRDVVGAERNPLVAAGKLEQWFATSGTFSYTTKLSVDDGRIDPILDFVRNRRAGHCEYFASSMAMMLRIVGIPSRVITGFKGGVYRESSHSLHVQQLHAHSWVEAYINRQWMTFDPTPGLRNEQVEKIQQLPSWFQEFRMDADQAWNRLAQLSQEAQQLRIYNPIRESAARMVKSVQTRTQQFREAGTQGLRILLDREQWFSWTGGVLAGAFMLLLSLCVWGISRLGRLIRNWTGLSDEEQLAAVRARQMVPFYERFLAILKRHEIEQLPTQTAREFVSQVLPDLKSRLPELHVDGKFDQLVQDFYEVRFGGTVLPDSRLKELNSELDILDAALQEMKDAP